jgi:hypothetical protein
MGLIDITDIAENQDFQKKVKGAMIKTAVLIVGELVIEGKETLGSKRHNLGVEILNSPNSKITPFSYAVAANPAINVNSVDGDIEFTVVTVYNDIAGVQNSEI